MKTNLREVRNSMIMLRNDAIVRRMDDLTLAYGWSVICMGTELLKAEGIPQQRNDDRT